MRTLISRPRAVARASIKLATLAQTSSNTSATVAINVFIDADSSAR